MLVQAAEGALLYVHLLLGKASSEGTFEENWFFGRAPLGEKKKSGQMHVRGAGLTSSSQFLKLIAQPNAPLSRKSLFLMMRLLGRSSALLLPKQMHEIPLKTG